jgi:hypothetical protein
MGRLLVLALLLVPFDHSVRAAELPSFLQRGDAFCTSETDFNDLVTNGHVRANSAIETCVVIAKPTRVAVMRGQGGVKSMVRVMDGPYSWEIGWTNGKLPLAS